MERYRYRNVEPDPQRDAVEGGVRARRGRLLAVDAYQIAALFAIGVPLLVLAPFALRRGVPGLRHDWIWPSDRAGLLDYARSAVSAWNWHGLGSVNPFPSPNLVHIATGVLALVNLPSQIVLWIVLAVIFAIAILGFVYLLADAAPALTMAPRLGMAILYAFSPIAFQKLVAGHIYWLFAYALLPVLSSLTIRATRSARWSLWALAGLVIAVMAVQVQFLFFGAILCIAVAFFLRPSLLTWPGVALALGIAIILNLALLTGSASGRQALDLHRAGVQWEIDLSTTATQLMRLSGYMHYDTAALSVLEGSVLRIGCTVLFFAALAGGLLYRNRLTAALALLGSIAALYVLGWSGFAKPVLQFWLMHSASFTLFRELYHGMAIVSLAVYVLAACYLALLRPWSQAVACAIFALSLLPFAVNAEAKLVPTVHCAHVGCTFMAPRTRGVDVAFPIDEPLSRIGTNSSGLDPARDSADAIAGAFPPYAYAALADPGQHSAKDSVLADLGISQIRLRPGLQSRLAQTFEPHVGADFQSYERRQSALRAQIAGGIAFPRSRKLVQLEAAGAVTPLDRWIADRAVPPGTSVSVMPNLWSNDIRRGWVSGELWNWRNPAFARLKSWPLVSVSGAPLAINAPRGAHAIYVLGHGEAFSLQGHEPQWASRVSGTPYTWLCWRTAEGQGKQLLRIMGDAAVAYVIAAADCRWRQPALRLSREPVVALRGLHYDRPWRVSGTLPETVPEHSSLVFARTYDPGWHLFIDGHDAGAAQQAHGIFNAWQVGKIDGGDEFNLTYVPESRAVLQTAFTIVMALAILLWAALDRPRKSLA